jgi:hypothetical protein
MNSLSWFIYLTQVVDSLRDAAQGVMVVGAFLGIMGVIFLPMAMDLLDWEVTPRQIIKPFVIAMAAAALAYSFIPSRQTMVMIAGSEIGERFAKSDAVHDVVNPGVELLKTWIKRETEKLAKETSK